MTTAIALLRAINVGTGRKVAMSDLRAIFAAAGCEEVTTYIQSGNVVFSHPAPSSNELAAELERRIKSVAKFDVPVILRAGPEWARIVHDNPFTKVETAKLHVAFLKSDPAPGALDALAKAVSAPEEFVHAGREIYMHLPNGMGRAKLPLALGLLKTPATARNWNTVTKLLDLAAR